jgi:TrmH family RNA methyltransferase
VRRLRELLRDPRARAVERACVVEGPRAVGAALDRGAPLQSVYLGPGAAVAFAPLLARMRAAGLRIAALKDGVLERVGTTVTPQPVLAVASASPSDPEQLGRDGLVLIGAGLADPGNVGTLLRSAEAAGAAGIVLGAGSVDAYNPKVVRASAGAIFGVALVEGWTVMEALDAMRATGRTCVGTRAEGGVAYHETDLARPTAVVLGNEAHGLPADLGAALDGWVTVPMRGASESLNVAMAGTVLCFEAARQRDAARRPR